jgi:crossover junction endodeoxyribonuclease RuvC
LIEAGFFRLGRGEGPSLRPVPDRLVELDADLQDVLDRLKPEVVAVEALFAHYKHPATAIGMGHARGIILLAARKAGLKLVELKPNEVKKFLTGHGHASKAQMQASVQQRLALAAPPEPPDVADAIAIAMCAASRMALAQL